MTRLHLIAIVLVLCVAAPAATPPAAAQPATVLAQPARRDQSISVGLWSLQGLAGAHAQYERLTAARRWSWIAGGGLRFNAGGDYGSSTLAAGGELRYWFKGTTLWATTAPRSMVGIYLGGRVDLAWTHTRDTYSGRAIGDNLAIAATLTCGYRFLIRQRVELTPMVGLGTTREIDLRGRLPSWRRGTARVGMTVGYMF